MSVTTARHGGYLKIFLPIEQDMPYYHPLGYDQSCKGKKKKKGDTGSSFFKHSCFRASSLPRGCTWPRPIERRGQGRSRSGWSESRLSTSKGVHGLDEGALSVPCGRLTAESRAGEEIFLPAPFHHSHILHTMRH